MRIFSVFFCVCLLLPLASCAGSSPNGTLDPEPAGETSASKQQDIIEIPVGSPASRVLQLLGPADATDTDSNGREIWRYRKHAEYAYVSNSKNAQALVIGKYAADASQAAPGQTLILTIVFDPAKKVADFNFAQLTF